MPKESGRNAETDSFMWLFRSGEDGLSPIILYRYTETMAKFNAEGSMKGFNGYLETDCHQGYNNPARVKRYCCGAHLERYFLNAAPKGKKLNYGILAAQGMQCYNRLFEYERQSKGKGHTFEQRKEFRFQKERQVLDAFWEWVGLPERKCDLSVYCWQEKLVVQRHTQRG